MKRSTRLLLITGVMLLGIGWAFQHFAFQSSSGPQQATITVFVKDKSARVFLQADVKPASPYKDWLTIDVTGARGKKEQWLLVVQCPSGSPIPAHQPLMKLYMESGEQSPSASYQTVLAWKHTGNWSGGLGCFSAPAASSVNEQSVSVHQGGSASFLNATLLSLEADPAAQQDQIITPMYAEQDELNGKLKDLVEVFQAPDSVCPTATSAYGQTPANRASSGTGSSTAPQSPGGTNVAAPVPNGASPNPSFAGSLPPTASPISAVCYNPISPHSTPTEYQLPTSVETIETLENADLTGYRVDSIFPPEQITQNDKMIWKGAAGLNPSISATSLSAERNNNRSLFIAGILFGLAGGVLVPVAQEMLILLDRAAKREDNVSAEPQDHT